ncbi:MAG: methyltransferase domain-containing protein [Planctomycetales bacterium]|nr:methyltransferase domain-containing protein [Planctomycetales bacterium]
MKNNDDWNDCYREGQMPWDTGRPSPELQMAISRYEIQPCRAIEFGCGTGTNCIWLAQQGFQVTGIDVAPLAVKQAQQRASAVGMEIEFLAADLTALPSPAVLNEFFFDRGCYHAVRRTDAAGYVSAVSRQLVDGARGFILAGNAREPHVPGPPVVAEKELREELGVAFEILDLREFYFDEVPGVTDRFLGWACLVAKR